MDRLVDACAGVDQPRGVGVDRLIDDIEDLLNTCDAVSDETLSDHPEVAASLMSYGSPAPASLAIATHAERLEAAKQLRRVLQRFEPRLSRVKVRVEQPNAMSNEGRFQIEAVADGVGRFTLPIQVRATSGRTQVTADRI